MAETAFKVEGLRELASSLRKVSKDLPKEQSKIHKQVAEPIAKRSASLAPKRSGKLAGSIRTSGTQRSAGIAAGRKSVPYAGPIHYGWPRRNISPQPFLTTAIHGMENETVKLYSELLDDFIERVWISL